MYTCVHVLCCFHCTDIETGRIARVMRESRPQTQGAWASRSRPADSERLRSLASPLCFCTFRLAAGSRAAGCVASLLMISDPVSCVNSYCLLHVVRQLILPQLILPTLVSCVNSYCLNSYCLHSCLASTHIASTHIASTHIAYTRVLRQLILRQLILPVACPASTHIAYTCVLHQLMLRVVCLASTHTAYTCVCIDSYCLHSSPSHICNM